MCRCRRDRAASPSRTAWAVYEVAFELPRLTSVELVANVALFVPVTYFATIVTRRPLVVLAGGALLSAVIEAVQALAPAIGRSCDAGDWAMNTAGAVIGVLLAWCTIRLVLRASRRSVDL